MLLEKNPSYGYKIGKEIERRTLGIWDPPSSTIYTVLKTMTERGLISFTEKQVDGRNRKIYNVTKKGEETLKLMLEKQNVIDESIETLKTAMLGDEKGVIPKGFHKLGPFNLIMDRLDKKSAKEKLEFLEIQKLRISQDITRLKERFQKIEESINEIKRKRDS
ncbi:MAG: PadR family transcriptional regulator [Candidatus Thorarchaeota archaeon]